VTGATPVGVAERRSTGLVDISNLGVSPSLQSLLPPATTPTSSPTSPAVQAATLLANSTSELFSSLTGGSGGLPDLSGLTGAAQAYSLYTNPAMLQQVAGNPASTNPSNAATANPGATFVPPAYSFNPFDEASWWTSPSSSLGTTVDATA
jgi:hypothetical protein